MPVKQDTEEKKTKSTLQDSQPKRTPPQGKAEGPAAPPSSEARVLLLSSSLGCIPFSAFGKRSETAGEIISGVVSIV